MQYLCYIEKINPSVRIKLEYAGTLDVKLVAAISFIIAKWWMDSSFPMILDAIQGDLEYDKILNTFDKYCTIVKDDLLEILNKDIVTVEDLLS